MGIKIKKEKKKRTRIFLFSIWSCMKVATVNKCKTKRQMKKKKKKYVWWCEFYEYWDLFVRFFFPIFPMERKKKKKLGKIAPTAGKEKSWEIPCMYELMDEWRHRYCYCCRMSPYTLDQDTYAHIQKKKKKKKIGPFDGISYFFGCVFFFFLFLFTYLLLLIEKGAREWGFRFPENFLVSPPGFFFSLISPSCVKVYIICMPCTRTVRRQRQREQIMWKKRRHFFRFLEIFNPPPPPKKNVRYTFFFPSQ